MEKKRCIFCMSEMSEEEESCPVCKRKPWQYQWNPKWLRPYTVLKKRYLIGIALGEGAFAVTYLAYDKKENIPVAIKAYYRNESGREAELLQKAESIPGVVKEKEFFWDADTSYLVMEYLEGGSLKSYLKKHHMISSEEGIRLLLPVMKTAALLHGKGIVHCDISPDNLLFDKEGVLKLIDFGAAVQKGEGEEKEEKELKESYAPVEQYQEKRKIGPWTDVYAICAVWYEMVTRHKVPAALERLKKDPLQLPSEYVKIPEDIENIFLRGLSVDIQRRYFSVLNLMSQIIKVTGEDEINTDTEEARQTAADIRRMWGDLWIKITTEVERGSVSEAKRGRARRWLRRAAGIFLIFVLATALAGGGLWIYCGLYPEKALAYELQQDRKDADRLKHSMEGSIDAEELKKAEAFMKENGYEGDENDYISTYRFTEEALKGWKYPTDKAGVFPIKADTMKKALDLYAGMERKDEDRRFNGYVTLYRQRRGRPLNTHLEWEEYWKYGEDLVGLQWDYVTEFVLYLSFRSQEMEKAETFLYKMLSVISPESYLTKKEIQELFKVVEEEKAEQVSIFPNCKCEVYISNSGYHGEYYVSIEAR